MQINITGHHIEVTQALRHYVENKCQRLERHFDQLSSIHVVLSVEKTGKRLKQPCTLEGLACLLHLKMRICMRL